MQNTKCVKLICGVGLLIFCTASMLWAQNTPKGKAQVVPGPVPAQIVNAKSVFISNTAPDGMPTDILQRFGEPNRPYDQLYAAMKSWGRYQLAASPEDADLVLEIHFTRSEFTGGIGQGAEFYLSILDTKTHFVLWTLVEPVEAAVRKVSWEKNIDDSVDRLVSDFRMMGGPGQQQ
jgi:hypothetical protein